MRETLIGVWAERINRGGEACCSWEDGAGCGIGRSRGWDGRDGRNVGSTPAKMYRRAEKAKYVSGKHSSCQIVPSCPSRTACVRVRFPREGKERALVPGRSPLSRSVTIRLCSLFNHGKRSWDASPGLQRKNGGGSKSSRRKSSHLGCASILMESGVRSQTLRTRDSLRLAGVFQDCRFSHLQVSVSVLCSGATAGSLSVLPELPPLRSLRASSCTGI